MEFLQTFFNLLLHLDTVALSAMSLYGNYLFLFIALIIFLETGLVLTPFLPGDSLLFTAGALSHQGSIPVIWLIILYWIAAVVGDTVNYWIGRGMGKMLLKRKMIKPHYYQKAHLFYEKHGSKAIILARFIPIIRTFIPFVAGLSSMSARTFTTFNMLGGIIWVFLFVSGGYFFGNLPFVQNHLSLIMLIVIFISFLPLIFHRIFFGSHKLPRNQN